MSAKPPSEETATPGVRFRATSYDVARLAGVSQSAVSRAFRAGASVSLETRAKVEDAARRLGYAPSQIARSLITQRSRMVGVVITDITARNYPDVLRFLAQEIQATGNQMLLCPVPDDSGGGAGVARLLAFHVDGIISSAVLPPDTLHACARQCIPVVLYNRAATGALATAVACDHEEAMETLVAHLHAGRLGRVVFLAGPESAPISNDRLAATRRALSSRGHAIDQVIYGDYSYEGGRAVAVSTFRHGRPDTVICGNDAMALGVMDGLRYDLGVRVPDEVAVAGFDDVQQAAWPSYELTTLSQPVRRMTRTAVGLLIDRVAGGLLIDRVAGGRAGDERHLLSAELKIRCSTRQPNRQGER